MGQTNSRSAVALALLGLAAMGSLVAAEPHAEPHRDRIEPRVERTYPERVRANRDHAIVPQRLVPEPPRLATPAHATLLSGLSATPRLGALGYVHEKHLAGAAFGEHPLVLTRRTATTPLTATYLEEHKAVSVENESALQLGIKRHRESLHTAKKVSATVIHAGPVDTTKLDSAEFEVDGKSITVKGDDFLALLEHQTAPPAFAASFNNNDALPVFVARDAFSNSSWAENGVPFVETPTQMSVPAVELATSLSAAFPNRKVFIAADLAKAEENYKAWSEPSGDPLTVLVDNAEGFGATDWGVMKEVGPHLRDSNVNVVDIATADASSTANSKNVIFLVGNKDEKFAEQVGRLGKLGALKGKRVVAMSCFEPTDHLLAALMIEYGAVGVLGFSRRIQPNAVKELMFALGDLHKDGSLKNLDPSDIVDKATNKASKSVSGADMKAWLRNIVDHRVIQLSENGWTGSVRSAATTA